MNRPLLKYNLQYFADETGTDETDSNETGTDDTGTDGSGIDASAFADIISENSAVTKRCCRVETDKCKTISTG